MRKIIFFVFALVLVADETKLSFSYEFQKEVLADKLFATVDLSFTRDTINESRLIAEKALLNARTLDGVCSGGAISITPEYHYDKGKTTLMGHTSRINLSCEFDLSKVEEFGVAVEKMQEFSAKELGRFAMSAPKRVVSHALNKAVQNELENEAVLFAFDRSKSIKDTLGYKKCNLTEVNFVANQTAPIFVRAMSTKDSIEPLETKEKIAIRASVIIDCK